MSASDRALRLYTKDIERCVLCGTSGSTLPGKELVKRPDGAWACRNIAWCARQRPKRALPAGKKAT